MSRENCLKKCLRNKFLIKPKKLINKFNENAEQRNTPGRRPLPESPGSLFNAWSSIDKNAFDCMGKGDLDVRPARCLRNRGNNVQKA